MAARRVSIAKPRIKECEAVMRLGVVGIDAQELLVALHCETGLATVLGEQR